MQTRMTLALCCLVAMTEAVKMSASKVELAQLSTKSRTTRQPNDNDRAKFLDYESKFGKHYTQKEEHDKRLQCFVDNSEKIAQLNQNSRRATYKLNQTADWTDEEFSKRLSHQGAPSQLPLPDSDPFSNHIGQSPDEVTEQMLAQASAQQETSFSWLTSGKVITGKDQSWCGSCWIFAAATEQESLQAIIDRADPVHISEQEGLDCNEVGNDCLTGGYRYQYWQMSKDLGSQADEGYPYEISQGACRNQDDKVVVSQAKSWNQVPGTIAGITQILAKRPISVAIEYDEDCWRWYESGVISDCSLGSRTYHDLVIVGREQDDDGQDYWIGVNHWGADWGMEGIFHIAAEEGDGVSLMNLYSQAVQVYSTAELYDDDDCADVRTDKHLAIDFSRGSKMAVNERELERKGWNDRATAVRVRPGFEVILTSDNHREGAQMTLSGSLECQSLGDLAGNVSWLVVYREGNTPTQGE